MTTTEAPPCGGLPHPAGRRRRAALRRRRRRHVRRPRALRDDFAFRAGQYLTLRLVVDAVEERRSYSICAPAGAAPRIGVRRVDTGLFSEWLVDGVQPGDEVEVAPPAGSFTPDLAPGTHHGLVAAGSGITPVLSIAATVLAAHADTHVTLVYGNRRTDTVMFTEEIADLKNAHGPRLHLLHVLSREPMAAEVVTGRLDAAKLRTLLGALVDVGDVDHWWLCGPLGMTTDAHTVLAELGVPRRRVHRELFYVDEPPPELHRADAAVDGGDERGHGAARRPGHRAHSAPHRERARRGAARALGPAVRLQGRGVRHVPRPPHGG